jgi:RimJ/RimL family protein N-acetyltransferase
MNTYKALNKQVFSERKHSIVPIRMSDRYDILKWRNEQMYHLRQSKPLTIEDQDNYFNTVVLELFEKEKPNQILFSFLENDICIGYGGLVHINWVDKHAEISFIMNTELEDLFFSYYWKVYLNLIEVVARSLKLHKIFTFAYDIRPRLYESLLSSGFYKEARLKDHTYFNNEYKDVLIHTKILD